ncbi:MAG: tRNA 2-selenouridine(34) synthase MnmH [Bacteroidia bacterium]
MPTQLDIQKFLMLFVGTNFLIDVRTSKEFEQGHIPGASNIPLFSNDERVVVGTIYKQQGKQPAILKGLEFVAPKMIDIVSKAQSLAKNNTLFVHCWRGGMRSESVAWLLELYGLKVFTLKGGYRSFRRYVLNSLAKEYNLLILGGKTGSAKTLVLEKLIELNEQVVNLEKLAAHKGSAFGALGENAQPSQEQFENELATVLQPLVSEKPIWMEDESRLIGNKVIPNGLWNQMRLAKTMCINLPFEARVEYLTEEYGKFTKEELKTSIQKITKRLGHQRAKDALLALDEGDLRTCCRICLSYYDKSYQHGIEQRTPTSVKQITFDNLDIDLIAKQLIKYR